MANTVYENFIVESKFNDNLDTRLNVMGLMTIDSGLEANEGMIVKINKYTYDGTVEQLEKGEGNSVRGSLTVETVPHEVKLYQQAFDYQDEDFMTDNKVVDYGVKGAANCMVNDLKDEFFDQIMGGSVVSEYDTVFSYDACVDAIAKMNLEDESGLMLLVGEDLKAQIRKDDDFKAKELGKVIADGVIGTLSGVPVIDSKAVPADTAFLFTREAVTYFTKKKSEVEQQRDADTRTNSIYMRRVGVVALTDETKLVKIIKG